MPSEDPESIIKMDNFSLGYCIPKTSSIFRITLEDSFLIGRKMVRLGRNFDGSGEINLRAALFTRK